MGDMGRKPEITLGTIVEIDKISPPLLAAERINGWLDQMTNERHHDINQDELDARKKSLDARNEKLDARKEKLSEIAKDLTERRWKLYHSADAILRRIPDLKLSEARKAFGIEEEEFMTNAAPYKAEREKYIAERKQYEIDVMKRVLNAQYQDLETWKSVLQETKASLDRDEKTLEVEKKKASSIKQKIRFKSNKDHRQALQTAEDAYKYKRTKNDTEYIEYNAQKRWYDEKTATYKTLKENLKEEPSMQQKLRTVRFQNEETI
jgi:hypothetical protein